MKMSNKTYDRLVWIAEIVLPAFAVFCLTTGELWGFSNTKAVAGTISAFAVFLGACLMRSRKNYSKEGIVKVFNEDLLKEQLALEYMAQEENTNDEDVKEEE